MTQWRFQIRDWWLVICGLSQCFGTNRSSITNQKSQIANFPCGKFPEEA